MIATENRNTRHMSGALLRERRRPMVRAARAAGRLRLETLEGRTLMSATWGTSELIADAAKTFTIRGSAADQMGDVYVGGYYSGSTGVHAVLREKLAGSSSWSDITPSGYTSFTGLGVDGLGNLYVNTSGSNLPGQQSILKRDVNTGAFSVLANTQGMGVTVIDVDSAGDVFIPNGGVRELVAGQTQFTTLLDVTAAGTPFSGAGFARIRRV